MPSFTAWRTPGLIALAVVVIDQATKQWLTPERELVVKDLEEFTQHWLHRATIVWALMNKKQSSLILAVDELDRKHQTSFLLPSEESSEEEGKKNCSSHRKENRPR